MRGLSVVLSTVTRWLEVFPPCAGVIGRVVHGYPLAGSIPPACGGYRRYLTSSRKAQTYSPRMRGLSAKTATFIKTSFVFPPHAGVIGLDFRQLVSCCCIPPVSGGYRFRTPVSGSGLKYSPRMRGLSALPDPNGHP